MQYSAARRSLGYDFRRTGKERDMAEDILIVKAGAERIQHLEPLWKVLHSRHLEVDPGLPGIPIRSQEEAWDGRRRLYAAWLAEQDAFLLIAEQRGRPVGYALTHLHEADESWDTRGRFGVLESLSVLPELRHRGVGRRLMSAVYDELRRLKVAVLDIGVVATNESARRFYERQGFAPWLIHYLGVIPGPGG
ncbi:MAG TPA: GNAT family N-acetyltransferase [Candidatus Dormibacteraeota bacterium]|nr:GNAT family N-acetyltransferase [Candidatus Dormibacteraeota bacterium]